LAAVADWQTISSLATAGGTLVLAVATFSAVRSANRSARIAEESLLTGMRNVGPGIALLHGWHPMPALTRDDHADPSDFRRLSVDLYVAGGGVGYWQGAIREPDDPVRAPLLAAMRDREPFAVDLLYGDQAGAQRIVSRCSVLPSGDDGCYSQAARHWDLDRPAPRS
jgi:hypothetical protein